MKRAVRTAAVAVTALVLPLLAPSSASACDVGVGYRPEISFGRGGLAGGRCETGTSLTGALLLFLLALAALAALGVVAYRRGQAAAAALAGAGGGAGAGTGAGTGAGPDEGADAALDGYLRSVGLSRGSSAGG